MSDPETEPSLDIFATNFNQGLDESIEGWSLGLAGGGLDPQSMGFDEREMRKLSPEEEALMKELIYRRFGLDQMGLVEARLTEYDVIGEDEQQKPIHVEVFKTNEEGLLLKQLTYTDGRQAWQISSDEYL